MKELIIAGDSWSFGSELIDPQLPSDIDELDEQNDSYRLSKIWPTLLKDKFEFDSIKNLAFPASSNDRIFRTLYNYLLKAYIKENKSFENTFVIVQLSSFDRKDFYFQENQTDIGKWQTIWPSWEHDYNFFSLNKFADVYSSFIKSDKEHLNRYITQIFNFQNFCKLYKIPFLIVQGFYHTKYSPNIADWYDEPYINLFNDSFCGSLDTLDKKYYEGSSELEMWNEIDETRFMNKKNLHHSLHSIIKTEEVKKIRYNLTDEYQLFKNMHPSEIGHKIISDYIENYIKKYNLLSF